MSQFLAAPKPTIDGHVDGHVDGHTVRRLQTRGRLLDAGMELFAEHGVRSVTTTAIARRAGVATGTFYLHFDDKHALFEELVQEAVREMGSQLDLDGLGPTDDRVRRLGLDHMMEVAERRRDLIRAVFDKGEAANLADRIQDRIARRLEPAYARLFGEREVALDPSGAAQARAAVIVRLVAWWAEEPSRRRRAEVVELLLALDPLSLPSTEPPPGEE